MDNLKGGKTNKEKFNLLKNTKYKFSHCFVLDYR